MSEYSIVEDKYRNQALNVLHARIRKGESVSQILKMDEDDYYTQKLINGMCPMSYTVYERIMQCEREDRK